jgi:NAD(P)-dependent dehydrogenase (short-subunit alcohol dehydrogenase family)
MRGGYAPPMSLVSLIKGRRGASGFGYASTAMEVTAGLDLRGRNLLITGVTSGLGLETARVLALRGARIFGCARDAGRAAAALAPLGDGHVPLACELAEPASVRACVDALAQRGDRLHGLIANAGIMALPRREVRHGHELQFLTNHLGHAMLVLGAVGRDLLADDARVVILSSSAHRRAPRSGIAFDDLSLERGYTPWGAYGQSKLANLLFARALARRFVGTRRTANAVHPGVIFTNLGRHMGMAARVLGPVASAIALKSVHQGAATQCYVAVHPNVAARNGEYFADCDVATSSALGRDPALAERLYTLTEALLQQLP